MRKALDRIKWCRGQNAASHIGLAYDVLAPVDTTDQANNSQQFADQNKKESKKGIVPARANGSDNFSSDWLDSVAGISLPDDYKIFFERWKAGFTTRGDHLIDMTTASRLLVGHGNPSATEVGLTVHHTWGVPIIPGSSLKGLTANFVETVYGPVEPTPSKDHQGYDYRGVGWRNTHIANGPGAIYRALFGAPEADDDDAIREAGHPAGAARGLVIFHDALLVPKGDDWKTPFAVDVLTVHQKEYYKSSGGSPPNDYDDPTPVQFLTVKPDVRFLLALSGPPDWTALAAHFLQEALEHWGVGGKTSSGYGRGKDFKSSPIEARSDVLKAFLKWLKAPSGLKLVTNETSPHKPTNASLLDEFEASWMARILALSVDERARIANELTKKIKQGKPAERARKIAEKLTSLPD